MSPGAAASLTFGIQTSTNSTALVQIVHRMGSTVGTTSFNSVLSSLSCDSNTMTTDQFLGPLEYVAPRVVSKTAGGTTNTVTVWLKGV